MAPASYDRYTAVFHVPPAACQCGVASLVPQRRVCMQSHSCFCRIPCNASQRQHLQASSDENTPSSHSAGPVSYPVAGALLAEHPALLEQYENMPAKAPDHLYQPATSLSVAIQVSQQQFISTCCVQHLGQTATQTSTLIVSFARPASYPVTSALLAAHPAPLELSQNVLERAPHDLHQQPLSHGSAARVEPSFAFLWNACSVQGPRAENA